MTRLSAIAALLLSTTTHAMPDAMQLGGETLAAASCGARRTLWFEHYTAALYLPGDAPAADELRDPGIPKALRLQIVNKRFMPSDVPPKWRKPMEEHLSAAELARGRRAYQTLREGDRMTIAYTPKEGVSLQVNGHVRASAPGHGLVEAIVETWADGAPLREKLDQVMARNRCTSDTMAGAARGPRTAG